MHILANRSYSKHAGGKKTDLSVLGFLIGFFSFLNRRRFGCRFFKPRFRFGFRLTDPTLDYSSAVVEIVFNKTKIAALIANDVISMGSGASLSLSLSLSLYIYIYIYIYMRPRARPI